jgi:hypothetical protein
LDAHHAGVDIDHIRHPRGAGTVVSATESVPVTELGLFSFELWNGIIASQIAEFGVAKRFGKKC